MKLNPKITEVEIEVPDRSGFDLSHEVLTTGRTGSLIPLTWFEVLPTDKIRLGALAKITLPPFAVPFMGRIDYCIEAFFVPFRQIWAGWENFIFQNTGLFDRSLPSSARSNVIPSVPLIDIDEFNRGIGPNHLFNYLYGIDVSEDTQIGQGEFSVSAFPALAYHHIVDSWYRVAEIEKPFFAQKGISVIYDDNGNTLNLPTGNSFVHVIRSFAYPTNYHPSDTVFLKEGVVNSSNDVFDGAISLSSLRQRSWAKDVFTTATYRPQSGADSSIAFSTDNDSSTNKGVGSISISSIRAANSLQKWLERNNIAGPRYGENMLAHFGVTPPSYALDEPILLGSMRIPVYVGSVTQNTPASTTDSASKNPFKTLGSAGGFGSASDTGSLGEIEAREHGIIMVLGSLVPRAYYGNGMNRAALHKKFGDFAWPEFAHIGDQPVYTLEFANDIFLYSPSGYVHTFGYNQRYYEYKMMPDKVGGLLHRGPEEREDRSLSVYALQRNISSESVLGSEFLHIGTDFLNPYFNVDVSVSDFTYMIDCYFDISALRPLPEFSLPRL